jgi:Kef-type K+ transport system membrane component KefB
VGVVIPHESGFAISLIEKVEVIVTTVFLPLYFAASGLNTQLGLVDSWEMVYLLLLVVATTCAGKIIGCSCASRFNGLSWRDSVCVGVLMNTKGLVELIVLNMGLEAGVISDRVFVIMVIVSTKEPYFYTILNSMRS